MKELLPVFSYNVRMNTIFFFSGTSGSGKSTRIYYLVQYLESLGLRTDEYSYRGRLIGRRYFDGSLLIIGKEVYRGNEKAWQGVDSYSDFLAGGEGHTGLYRFFFDTSKSMSLVLDSAILFRTNRSRPLYIESQGVESDVYHRSYYYRSFESYRQRIYDRTSGTRIPTQDSPMWNNNSDFPRYIQRFNEELGSVEHPERFTIEHGDPEEPLYTIGDVVLRRVGRADLVDEFHVFCEKNPLGRKKIQGSLF